MSVADRQARATYHPHGYGVSEGLARARRPFRTANFLTGAVIAGFTFSVYVYSIRAVKQDDFSDVVLPSDLDREGVKTIEEEETDRVRRKKELKDGFGLSKKDEFAVVEEKAVAVVGGKTQAVWEVVRKAFGGKGEDSKLVVGAPPVDRLGRIGSDGTVDTGRRLV